MEPEIIKYIKVILKTSVMSIAYYNFIKTEGKQIEKIYVEWVYKASFITATLFPQTLL